MDWLRLQKALAVEAERGFNDLMGNQYRFSEFLSFSLNEPPTELSMSDRQRLQDIATQFAQYPDLGFADRQHLVAESRRVLHQVRKDLENKARADAPSAHSSSQISPFTAAETTASTKTKVPKTVPLTEPGRKVPITLDQAVTFLPGIGAKNSEKLAKLGLYTVRDILYYYRATTWTMPVRSASVT